MGKGFNKGLNRGFYKTFYKSLCTRVAWALWWSMWGGAMVAHALPSFDEVRRGFQSSDVEILDRHAEVLQRVRVDYDVRRGQWVKLSEVSPAVQNALIVSEDKRFYEHSGVDWWAVSAAAWANLWNERTRGASTLTMQLAGLLDEDLRLKTGGRTVRQKLGQTVAAQVLDRRWRKDQILEAYLNLVPLRGELVGIDAISRHFFNKAAHGLDEREAAVIVALVRAPNATAQQVSQRACSILKALAEQPMRVMEASDCFALRLFVQLSLQRRALSPHAGIAPHWAHHVLKQLSPSQKENMRVSQQISTSLSAPVQRFASESLRQHLKELSGRNVHDGAVLVLDNASGEVLAWVGSSGDLSQASEVDTVLGKRQAGSTLKPFLYAQAIAEKRLTAASLLEDSEAQIHAGPGLYIPQNYDRRFRGWVSVREALAASLNVPAVRALIMVTPAAFHRQLTQMGLVLREDGDYFGYSLALGSAEVSLLQLTNAYRTLANGGCFQGLSFFPVEREKIQKKNQQKTLPGKQEKSGARQTQTSQASPPTVRTPCAQQAVDERAAWVVGDILSDRQARVSTFGLDSVLGTRFWSAVKTGTSKDMRDNWALGWSQRYTVGVWVGNARGESMHDVSGTTGAAPVWASVMAFLHQNQPSRAPAPPPGLVQQRVHFGEGKITTQTVNVAARQEWFLEGTQQAEFSAHRANLSDNDGEHARILTPTNGTIVGLDPDIPPARQRVWFTTQEPHQPGRSAPVLSWWLDGQRVGQGAHWAWMPWPGHHTIELRNARNMVLDKVQVEVRGAVVTPSTHTQAPRSTLRE